MILALGSAADDTFMHSVQALKSRGARLVVIDLVHLALQGHLQVSTRDALSSYIGMPAFDVRLDEIGAVLCRLVDVAAGAPPEWADRAAAVMECLCVMLNRLPLLVANAPPRDVSNASKFLHQALLGADGPWRLPDTLLTNDATEVRAFAAAHERCIIKGASGFKTWAQELSEEHVRRMEAGAPEPVLLQDRICGADVRVHVVGERCFAEKIVSDYVDYRKQRTNKYAQVDLPELIAKGCVALAKRVGSPLVGVDFKWIEATGEWVWLEVNTSPCYEGYDRRACGRISLALTDLLTDADRSCKSELASPVLSRTAARVVAVARPSPASAA